MQTADFNHNDFNEQGAAQADEGLLVKFLYQPLEDSTETAKQGRPVFKDVLFIDIRVPGQRDGVRRRAMQYDIDRFPRHYAAFKNRMESAPAEEGTPLSEWPGISASRIQELAFFNVKTVEQLARISDQNLQNFMGGNNLKRQAQEWLEATKDAKAAADLRADLAERDEKIAEQDEKIAEQGEEIAELRAAVKDLQAAAKPKVGKKKTSKKKASVKKE